MTQTAFRTCPLCEATCGLAITVEDGEVTDVRGDKDDVFSHGYICPKGATIGELDSDPDRLRQPQIRTGDTWREVSWDEAFEEINRRLMPLLEEHGRNSVALYLGNPNVHNLAGSLYAKPVAKAFGTRNIFSASTVDQMPKHVSSGYLFGDPTAIPIPDLDRTDYLLLLGANPLMSNGSLCTAPDFPGRLKALRKRGGKLVVVDPRRSRTAKKADLHLFIKPGTDAIWLAAIANVLISEDLISMNGLAELTDGIDDVKTALASFTPEATAAATGIPAEQTRQIARELADAPTAAVYGRMGTTTVTYGTVGSWLVDVINILTGNLDRPGGALFPLSATAATPRPVRDFETGRWTSTVRGAGEVLGELPVAVLAEEIEAGGIRALVTIAGNPVLSTPNSQRLDAALDELDLIISVDPYLNETTRHADVILPPEGILSRSHYDVAFYPLAVRNIANYSAPIFDLDGNAMPEWHILLRLSAIALGMGPDADIAQADDFVFSQLVQRVVTTPGGRYQGRDAEEVTAELTEQRGPERVLDLLLRAGPYGESHDLSMEKLRENPHGIDLGPLSPRLPDAIRSPSGRINLAPPVLTDDLAALASSLNAPSQNGHAYTLVGRRHVRSNNSWGHNVGSLAGGADERTALHVHPDDAAVVGLKDGGSARVTSRVGSVTATVLLTEDVMPGVVSLPHGWGHDLPGTKLSVASTHPGPNMNALADEQSLDGPSGTAVLNGIPVTLSPAE